MLSVELGTHLTGRHLSMELFPFSYSEYRHYKNWEHGEETVLAYLKSGGMPEYVKSEIPIILNTLVDDILIRDVVFRQALRDVASLRQLTSYLINNIGTLISANKMQGMFGIKSPATFLDYFSFLKDAYLLEFIPMFSHLLKVQVRNPKKVYVMDMGLYTENSVSTSENLGRRLENLIFIHLRRKHKHIFYYKGRGECDFVVMEKNAIKDAIQVCWNINDENFDREYKGLVETMQALNLRQGTIVTLNQSDTFEKEGMTVKMVPAHQFLEPNS